MRKSQIIILILLGIVLFVGWPWLMNQIWPPKPKPDSPMVKFGQEMAAEGAANVQLLDRDLYVDAFGKDAAAQAAAIRLPNPDKEAVAILTGQLPTFLKPVSTFSNLPKPVAMVGEETATLAITQSLRRLPAEVVAQIMRRLPMPGAISVDVAKIGQNLELGPAEPVDLIPMGHGAKPYYLQVLLRRQGGSIQQITLSAFDEADREGLEVKVNGKPKHLHLVPGLEWPRARSLRAQRDINAREPELKPGTIDARTYRDLGYPLSPPSYVMFHYEKPNDERPVDLLGDREWRIAEVSNDETADEQRVVFQTELSEPYNLIITKTFTLKRREYHVGMQVDIARIPGKTGVNQFRYQIQGAHGLPIEGEWYTSTFHQVIVGFGDDKGNTSRYIEDASQIREWSGSDRQTRTDKLAIRYAAATVQYFASVIAVDDQQENRRFVEYVRATPWGPAPEGKDQKFLNDATVRTITESFDPTAASHKYLLYQGPIKVRLLRQMSADKGKVDDALVERYLDKITLKTMTDEHMPNALGRFANAIFWSDLVIGFTNLIHSLLWLLYQIVPNLGICIILLTIIVRGILFPLSRRQAYNAQIMQAKMAKLQPELTKIKAKYADDRQMLHTEMMRLYREHGVNPFAMLGGCLTLLLQMPVFMGLYYALQESVFFRLEGFLWIPNLAAPDMLFRWGEAIPFISTPEDMGGGSLGGMLYLGPYFNVLPILAVTLMLIQQKKMMPPSDDPQVQAQQRMMKFMMILFGLFFYKVAAGLCIYFIASTLWGLAERRFMPKAPPSDGSAVATGGGPQPAGKKEAKVEDRPLGWWGRTKARWKEKWKKILEEAQKQAEYRREQRQKEQPPPPGAASPRPGGSGKKKKKKR